MTGNLRITGCRALFLTQHCPRIRHPGHDHASLPVPTGSLVQRWLRRGPGRCREGSGPSLLSVHPSCSTAVFEPPGPPVQMLKAIIACVSNAVFSDSWGRSAEASLFHVSNRHSQNFLAPGILKGRNTCLKAGKTFTLSSMP